MCSNTLASIFTNYSPVLKVIFHQTLSSNFVTVSTLKILSRLAYVAALPCEILTMQLMLVCADAVRNSDGAESVRRESTQRSCRQVERKSCIHFIYTAKFQRIPSTEFL